MSTWQLMTFHLTTALTHQGRPKIMTENLACMPIHSRDDRIIAVVSHCKRQELGPFDEDDRIALEAISARVATALERLGARSILKDNVACNSQVQRARKLAAKLQEEFELVSEAREARARLQDHNR